MMGLDYLRRYVLIGLLNMIDWLLTSQRINRWYEWLVLHRVIVPERWGNNRLVVKASRYFVGSGIKSAGIRIAFVMDGNRRYAKTMGI